MTLIKICSIAIFAILIGACGSETAKQTKTEEKPSTKTEKKEEATPVKKEEAPEKAKTDDTPTKAVKEFAKAYQEKNVVRLKMRMSGKTVENMAKQADAKGVKLDDAVKSFIEKASLPIKGVPETRNEKITGDTATIEIKGGEQWATMPLVLENGKWRIAFDKRKPGS